MMELFFRTAFQTLHQSHNYRKQALNPSSVLHAFGKKNIGILVKKDRIACAIIIIIMFSIAKITKEELHLAIRTRIE